MSNSKKTYTHENKNLQTDGYAQHSNVPYDGKFVVIL